MGELTDRELLERAAKAVGLETKWDQPRGSKTGWLRVRVGDRWPVWTPLDDDGEALRLAGNLHMEFSFRPSYVMVTGEYGPNSESYDKQGKMAAARRAIVRTAAQEWEIGKGNVWN